MGHLAAFFAPHLRPFRLLPLTLLLLAGTFAERSNAQCPCSGSCVTGSDINIGSGTCCVPAGTYNNVNINGGTLVICSGTVNFSSVNYNGGNITVESGATLNVNGGGVLDLGGGGGRTITNNGTLNFNRALRLQSSNNAIVNGNNSTFLVDGQLDLLNSGNSLTWGTNATATVDGNLTVQGSNQTITVGGGSVLTVNTNLFMAATNGQLNICGFVDVDQNLQFNSNNTIAFTCDGGGISVGLNITTGNGTWVGFADGSGCLTVGNNAQFNVAPPNGTVRTCVDGNINGSAAGSVVEDCSGSCGATPFPVVWQNFEAEANGETVLLNWSVTDLGNVSHYEIQRSADGETFAAIAQLPHRSEAYRYEDRPGSGSYQYRVLSVDYDGAALFSAIREVTVDGGVFAKLSASPNPATAQALFSFAPGLTGSLDLTDLQGRTVRSVAVASDLSSLTLDLNGLTPGCYVARLSRNGSAEHLKLVLAGAN